MRIRSVRLPLHPRLDRAKGVCLLLQYKAVRVCGGENNGGHVLRETTIRGLCGLVCSHHALVNAGECCCFGFVVFVYLLQYLLYSPSYVCPSRRRQTIIRKQSFSET
jgi:hypothetical protein